MLEYYGYLSWVLASLEDTLDEINSQVSAPFAYYEISRVVEEKTQTVLTSKRKREEDVESSDRLSLDFFRPAFVSGHDTTANLGMAHIMSRICNMYLDLLVQKQYMYVRLDAAVYFKWLRVFFNTYRFVIHSLNHLGSH